MRKIKTVKIELEGNGATTEEKSFTIKEMTCQDILDLSQGNIFFSDSHAPKSDEEPGNGEGETKSDERFLPGFQFIKELQSFGMNINDILKRTADFTLDDLKPLAPSEVKEVFEGFKEVNQDFLEVLEKLGIIDAFHQVLKKVTNSFSEIVVV